MRAPHRFVPLVVATALVALASCNQSDEIRRQALEDSTAVTFPSTDGVELAGRLFGPDTATAGVVLAHMLPADQRSWFDFADRLGGSGYRALTFDFRGYCPGGAAGCSDGEKDVGAIWQDVQGAVEFLRSQGVRDVGLVGASMGGTASLVVASELGDEIAVVITLSAPDAIDGLAATPETLQRITAAKLHLAGVSDGSAAQVAQGFYDQGLPPKRVEILTTGDHGTDLLTGNQAEIARNLILGWLAQHLPAS
ncbi:MAG TPA: alpha/beta fold hydrolase [Actinomycetota bacterium]